MVWHEINASVRIASVTLPVYERGTPVLAFVRDNLGGDTEKERCQCPSLSVITHVIGDAPGSVGRSAP